MYSICWKWCMQHTAFNTNSICFLLYRLGPLPLVVWVCQIWVVHPWEEGHHRSLPLVHHLPAWVPSLVASLPKEACRAHQPVRWGTLPKTWYHQAVWECSQTDLGHHPRVWEHHLHRQWEVFLLQVREHHLAWDRLRGCHPPRMVHHPQVTDSKVAFHHNLVRQGWWPQPLQARDPFRRHLGCHLPQARWVSLSFPHPLGDSTWEGPCQGRAFLPSSIKVKVRGCQHQECSSQHQRS